MKIRMLWISRFQQIIMYVTVLWAAEGTQKSTGQRQSVTRFMLSCWLMKCGGSLPVVGLSSS